MRKKLLALLLACAVFITAGCGGAGTDSPHWIDSSIEGNVTADTTVSLKDDFPGFVDGDGQIFFLNEGIHILVAVGLDVFFESFFDLCDLFVIEFKGKIAHIL